ncbi:hypothetical protein BCR44DRAFT_89610 [Catenaria anguillulae PL171]|uniref:Caspase domain-domain-containing protein n=1 Tax=Catenaria anguillulae PL171 TaxID=765915 RepID=A0A1Y2HL92_9FUNG|nr:hypothetical protein BCR44DRAFT_89610 [Catenaria anguillulae PL171]
MPTTALCVGLTHPSADSPRENFFPQPENATANDAMVSFCQDRLGVPTTNLTDADGTDVSKDDILNALRDMIANAEPGDNLIFSYAGSGRVDAGNELGHESVAEALSTEEGLNEFIRASNGDRIYDYEIAEILKEVPEGVSLAVVMDSDNAAGMSNMQLGIAEEIPGNVVFLAGASEMDKTDPNALSLAEQFSQAFDQNPSSTWNELVDSINTNAGENSSVNVVANRPEVLDQPLYQWGEDSAAGNEDGFGDLAMAQMDANLDLGALDDVVDCSGTADQIDILMVTTAEGIPHSSLPLVTVAMLAEAWQPVLKYARLPFVNLDHDIIRTTTTPAPLCPFQCPLSPLHKLAHQHIIMAVQNKHNGRLHSQHDAIHDHACDPWPSSRFWDLLPTSVDVRIAKPRMTDEIAFNRLGSSNCDAHNVGHAQQDTHAMGNERATVKTPVKLYQPENHDDACNQLERSGENKKEIVANAEQY